jgi:hypothetical protein
MPDIDLSLIANNEPYIAAIKEAQQSYQGFSNSVVSGSKQQEQMMTDVVEGIKVSTQDFVKEQKTVIASSDSLKKQLRLIREEMMSLDQAGKSDSKAFMDMAIKAGELKKQINETGKEIKVLSSHTSGLNTALSAGSGLASGFSVAEGAMAVFGESGENLQKQLVKLQGGMNLLNGLEGVANTLHETSAARVGISTTAYKLYNLVVGQSSGVMKVFKIALASTGIGLLIIGIGLLVANWDKLSKSIMNSIAPQSELNKQIEKQITLVDDLTESTKQMNDERERENKILEAQGNKEDLIFKNKVESLKESLKLKLEEIALTRLQIKEQQNDLNKVSEKKGVIATIVEAYKDVFGNSDKTTVGNIDVLNKKLQEQISAQNDLSTELQALAITEGNRIKKAKDESGKKQLEAQAKAAKELAELLKQLADKEEAAKLSQLTGKDRIEEETRLQLEEVNLLEDHFAKLKQLTTERSLALEDLRTSIKKEALKKIEAIDSEEVSKNKEQGARILALQQKIDEDQVELTNGGEKEKLEVKLKYLKKSLEAISLNGDEESKLTAKNLAQQIGIVENEIKKLDKKSGFSIWKLMGIDPDTDEGKKAVEAFKESASIIMDQINQIMDAEVEQAEKHTQEVDDRLTEAEDELKTEEELQKNGYANNVDGKKQEIAELKIEKEKALEEEKKLKKEQIALDAATQVSSLITATSGIFASYSKLGVIGSILAIAAIAAMWGTFAAAKVKAVQAVNTKAEKGLSGDSTGIISGNRHAQGGEKFSDHIEVEQGEAWGVWNRSATQKFGKFIPYMVDSMNKLQFPNMDFSRSNSTIVNVPTNKMENELKSINSGLKTLNDNITSKSEMFYSGKTRIVKVSQNHTRIIHAAN